MERSKVFLPLMLLLAFCSCHRVNDPLIGRWTVEKVNVEFDEHIATPEMVTQFGELEKGNVIEISKDFTLMFLSDGDTLRMKCELAGNRLMCDGNLFGIYENGTIRTELSTPLGKVTVCYVR